MIQTAKRELNVTSLVVSHDLPSTFRMADKIAMLFDGRILVQGTSEEIKNSRVEIVRKFIYLSGTGPLEPPGVAA